MQQHGQNKGHKQACAKDYVGQGIIAPQFIRKAHYRKAQAADKNENGYEFVNAKEAGASKIPGRNRGQNNPEPPKTARENNGIYGHEP